MAGGIKLEPRPAEERPADPGALAPPPPAPPPAPGRTRRLLLRTAFALGATGTAAAALTPVLRAGRRTAAPSAGAPGGESSAESFDEMYRGRHLRGTAAGVRVDGRPLHLMRRADGSHVSVVNHFEAFPTPLAAARAAVDDLGDIRLAPDGPAFH